MPCETIVAIGGNAHALDIDDLDREMRENERFRDVLTQYSHALLIHCMRMTGCTGLHTLARRCSRWILTTLDRVSEDRFSMSSFPPHGRLTVVVRRRQRRSVELHVGHDRGGHERTRIVGAHRRHCPCGATAQEHAVVLQ